MVWTIKYAEIAAKQMKKLDKKISQQIHDDLTERVAKQKDPTVFGKLLLHEKSGLWRYRVNDYRIICEIHDNEVVVLVLRIGHRSKIYKT